MKEANENKKKKLSMTHQFVRFESYTHISFSNEFLMFTFYIDINKKMINLVSFNRADWFFFFRHQTRSVYLCVALFTCESTIFVRCYRKSCPNGNYINIAVSTHYRQTVPGRMSVCFLFFSSFPISILFIEKRNE